MIERFGTAQLPYITLDSIEVWLLILDRTSAPDLVAANQEDDCCMFVRCAGQEKACDWHLKLNQSDSGCAEALLSQSGKARWVFNDRGPSNKAISNMEQCAECKVLAACSPATMCMLIIL